MAYGPRAYSSNGTAASGTNKGVLLLGGVTTTRPGIYDIILGVSASAAPADVALGLELIRTTADGAGGATGDDVALDEASPAALADTLQGAWTAEPTKTAAGIMLTMPMNSRATFRWVAAPGSEIMLDATATDGLLINSLATNGGTPDVVATMLWKE